jgi:hypothetical protein
VLRVPSIVSPANKPRSAAHKLLAELRSNRARAAPYQAATPDDAQYAIKIVREMASREELDGLFGDYEELGSVQRSARRWISADPAFDRDLPTILSLVEGLLALLRDHVRAHPFDVFDEDGPP